MSKKIAGILKANTALNNKTGSWRSKKPIWDKERCIHCMICYNNCPDRAIKYKEENGEIKRGETDFDYCKGCGLCEKVCPVRCIKMIEEGEE